MRSNLLVPLALNIFQQILRGYRLIVCKTGQIDNPPMQRRPIDVERIDGRVGVLQRQGYGVIVFQAGSSQVLWQTQGRSNKRRPSW
jgi:hypothetical protein